MICFGVLNALAAPIAGALVKTTGRYPVMVTALVCLDKVVFACSTQHTGASF